MDYKRARPRTVGYIFLLGSILANVSCYIPALKNNFGFALFFGVVSLLGFVADAKEQGKKKKADEFLEREIKVLIISDELNEISESQNLPEPFSALVDSDGKVQDIIGGAPAFYLVGKDTEIKISSRRPRGLEDIFRLVDSMPMRKEEMRRRG